MIKFLNLTKHDINMYVNGELMEVIDSDIGSGNRPPRVSTETSVVGEVFEYEIRVKKAVKTDHLPDLKEGTYVIVPRMIAEANPDRTDLLIPDGYVYIEDKIVGCTGFARIK